MSDVEKQIRDTVKHGGVLAMLYFDVHAKTSDLVKQLGAGFIKNIIQKDGVVFALGEIDEPVGGDEGKNWSSSVSIKVLTKDFKTLSSICAAHSPYTVEILRPDEIKLSLNQAHDVLGLMSATSAEYKRYILTKIAKPEELAQIQENLKKRAEMGKKIIEKKDE